MKNNDKILKTNCSNLGEIYRHFPVTFQTTALQAFALNHANMETHFTGSFKSKQTYSFLFILEGVIQTYLYRCTKLQPCRIFKFWKAGRKQQKMPNDRGDKSNERSFIGTPTIF